MMSDPQFQQNILLIISMVLSVAAFVFSYLTSTKKYELGSQYRSEILKWYSDTITLMKRAKAALDNQNEFELKNIQADLSSQIDIGRFYFPNLDRGDNKGISNPSAYQGYRNLVLDTLVFYHFLLEDENRMSQSDRLRDLQRIFTSQVFDQLDPKDFIKQTTRHTNKDFYSSRSIFDDAHPTLLEIDEYIRMRSLKKENPYPIDHRRN